MIARLTCLIWGHAVDNHVFAEHGRACTRCGKTCLRNDPAPVRIGHTLSCFLNHHTYEPVGARDGHMEYACVQCGHPLLFPRDADPYSAESRFEKRVRYLCGLFGHHVHRVAERDGGVEYHLPLRPQLRAPAGPPLAGPSSALVRAAGSLGVVRAPARRIQRVCVRDLRTPVPVRAAAHSPRGRLIVEFQPRRGQRPHGCEKRGSQVDDARFSRS